jgi:hypothetical protein
MMSQRLCTPHRPVSGCQAIAVRNCSQTRYKGDKTLLVKHLSSVTGLVSRRLTPLSCSSSYSSSRSSSIVCRASSRGPSQTSSKLKRSIWTAVDVIALLGSVGGALAALLGLVAPTYALVLPLVLPVVSLIAALQREDLSNEVRLKIQHTSEGSAAALYGGTTDERCAAHAYAACVALHTSHTWMGCLSSMVCPYRLELVKK